ncbi:hypothetical protein EK904_002724 [Melospiza melodia maxima]|nr:hypothetical protein EK904_002724 [Melospiza melodia maxima]
MLCKNWSQSCKTIDLSHVVQSSKAFSVFVSLYLFSLFPSSPTAILALLPAPTWGMDLRQEHCW